MKVSLNGKVFIIIRMLLDVVVVMAAAVVVAVTAVIIVIVVVVVAWPEVSAGISEVKLEKSFTRRGEISLRKISGGSGVKSLPAWDIYALKVWRVIKW